MTKTARTTFRLAAWLIATTLCPGLSPAGEAEGKPKWDIPGPQTVRENVFAFTKKPTLVRKGDGYEISFESQGACDAMVAVVNAEGRVVRHLAAGVLGKNAPEPFAKGSLSQTVSWDGRDDKGEAVPAGCVVKVGLGLRPRFERLMHDVPHGVASRGPAGIVCDDKGNLFVAQGAGKNVGAVLKLKAFDRDGKYVKHLIPFRSDWPAEKTSAVQFTETADGTRIPLTGAGRHRHFTGFLPGIPGMTRHTPMITRDGRFIFPGGNPMKDAQGRKYRRMLSVGMDGSASKEQYFGPPLPADAWCGDTFTALSPDQKHIYISGTGIRWKGSHHAVFRVAMDAKEPPQPFAGTLRERGTDNEHFNDPRGVATDLEGRVYVCDYRNDRIQVFSPEGKYLRTVALRGPEQIHIHPKTKAVYVLSVKNRGEIKKWKDVRWEFYGPKWIVKFRSTEDMKEVARIGLSWRERHFHDCGPIMCLDASAEKPVIWAANVGRQMPTDYLWKIVDEGEALKQVKHPIIRYDRRQSVMQPHMVADREHNEFYMFGGGVKGLARVDPATGNRVTVTLPDSALQKVGDVAIGPRGMLYVCRGEVVPLKVRPPARKGRHDMVWRIRRYDREGKLVPFEAGEAIDTLGHHNGFRTGEKSCRFAVAPDGKVYATEWSKMLGPRCRVNQYGADGKLLKAGFVADMTKTAGDVAVDGRGRLYVADAIKPKLPGVAGGKEIPPFLSSDPRGNFRMWFGSICRFPPEGGSIHHLNKGDSDKATHRGFHNAPVELRGADWFYYGISPVTQGANCECVIARMDADGWGRVFFPDAICYRACAIDSAGNFITGFGSYGNCDAQGPKSEVPKPEIPFFFPAAVAVLDDWAAVADRYNRRVVQVKLDYHVQETVPMP